MSQSPTAFEPSHRPSRWDVPRPFLKWAGGKTQLLEQLIGFAPTRYRRYFEPFIGGGALFFRLRPTKAWLADRNAELIELYQSIRDHTEALIDALLRHPHTEEHFYEMRAQDPEALSPVDRAARTIYLNRTGFNGLYRVNASGQFNVPFGRYTNPRICDAENLRACAAALAGVVLKVGDFSVTAAAARRGDFVYFDPPYVPSSATADFTSYAPGGFDWDAQLRLRETFEILDRRGVHVMLSNSDVPEVRDLYAGYRIEAVQALRRINSKASARGPVGELVILGRRS